MLEHLRKRIKIPAEKFVVNLATHANTTSASIPMALSVAHSEGRVASGQRVMVVGFGVGYSWAAAFIKPMWST